MFFLCPTCHVGRQKFMSGIFSFMSGIRPSCPTPNGAPECDPWVLKFIPPTQQPKRTKNYQIVAMDAPLYN